MRAVTSPVCSPSTRLPAGEAAGSTRGATWRSLRGGWLPPRREPHAPQQTTWLTGSRLCSSGAAGLNVEQNRKQGCAHQPGNRSHLRKEWRAPPDAPACTRRRRRFNHRKPLQSGPVQAEPQLPMTVPCRPAAWLACPHWTLPECLPEYRLPFTNIHAVQLSPCREASRHHQQARGAGEGGHDHPATARHRSLVLEQHSHNTATAIMGSPPGSWLGGLLPIRLQT
jgi:hypothetical protein